MKGSLLKKGFAALAAFAVGISGLALGVTTANAAAVMPTTKTITLNAEDAAQFTGHTFKAVKIAAYSVDNGVAGVKTVDAYKSEVTAALKDAGATVPDGKDPLQWALETPGTLDQSGNSASKYTGKTRLFADYLAKDPTVVAGLEAVTLQDVQGNDKQKTITLPDVGLYLIVDDAAVDSTTTVKGSTRSLAIVVGTPWTTTEDTTQTVLSDGVVDMKNTLPTIGKVIVKDGQETDTDKVSVGDKVPYRLKGNVPNYTGYTTYTYKMIDTLSKGLTFINETDDKPVVKIGTKILTENKDYTVTVKDRDAATGKQVVEIDFTDFVNTKPTIGDSITVEYHALLNDDAVIRNNGNPNDVKLEYSNNPYDDSKHDTTPPYDPVVYTYDFNFKKVDKEGNGINNASFKVYEGANADPNKATALKFTGSNGVWTKATASAANIKEELASDASGYFTLKGFGPGKYTVYEYGIPTGYAQVRAKFTVTIDENGDASFADNSGLGLVKANDTVKDNGVTYQKVLNVKNLTELPLTGAAGTALFTVIAVLLAGAAATVFAKSRRTSKALQA
ncbi:SpaH/EbpB family LPXTG-anchored major pilin [Bifidobacterium cebidarum]|uniref:Collagen-binding protein n=1 Tax=Bifidobacterium cebidarum TaxID=2650773 RepID=A0A6I1GN46_9BIFI|nr:SpaH/EbpB family LPXTG-anchored major pilin [Bifidobacterium cebidarum]KAB7789478.1 collagen-binding protein [Bifidobacterium cebidarum]